ncbi:MAG: hypothetical protein JXR94_21400, partial [Candidatus Hydrogenedentes bacterium]|nr:hypothetical protein [Candidatus Hydrogenedentota bacterium]
MEYLIVVAVIVVAVFLAATVRRITVFEYERGLRYVKGRFRGVLSPGHYWYVRLSTHIRTLDIRPRFVSITGQEVLSADGVTLKLSLAASFEIVEPDVAINKVMQFQEALYIELQLALRQIIGQADIDTVLSGRDELSKQ